jgi:hypothetical protein
MKPIILAFALSTAVAAMMLAPGVFGGRAFAAGAGECNAYTDTAVKAAKEVSDLRCGYDLSNPQWSTNPDVHRKWCRNVNQDSVDHEKMTREEKLTQCRVCRAYADAAMAAIKVNKDLKCGFTGERWADDEAAHFGWCMGLSDHSTGGMAGLAGLYKPMSSRKKESLDPETGARTQAAEECKLTKKQSQPLVARPPQIKSRPTEVATEPKMQRRAPKGTTTKDEAIATIQRPGPEGTTTVDKANPCRSGGSPCKPKSNVLGTGILEGDTNLVRPGPAAVGPSTGGTPSSAASGNMRVR